MMIRRAATVLVGALAIVACSSSTPAKKTENVPPNNVDPSGSDGGETPQPKALPLLVSDEFFPSGFMGDSKEDFLAVTQSKDLADCKTPRTAEAAGDCYTVNWTPVFLPEQKTAWVGVYWQYPGNNWGGKTGLPIQPGATKVTFYAAGKAGGEQVEFIVGGVNSKDEDPTLPNKDSFTVKQTFTLTTEWARYEIPLKDAQYSNVIGGFGWAVTTSQTSATSFYIDDVRWEP